MLSIPSFDFYQDSFHSRRYYIKTIQEKLSNSWGNAMEAITESILVREIVEAIYASDNQIRERYYLTQSLHLLLFFSKRSRSHTRDQSLVAMRRLISRLTNVTINDGQDNI